MPWNEARRLPALLVGAALLAVLGCTATDPATAPGPEQSPSPSATDLTPTDPASTSPEPTEPAEPTEAADGSPASGASPTRGRPAHPVSLPALFDTEFDGRRLRLGDVLVRTDAYTQHAVTYQSDGLTVSGVMNIPDGPGPFPTLVLAHGYIDPAFYVTGQGLRREQDWLARAGYVVLHVDYRNHAGSDADPPAERRLRLGYTADVINAVHALRRSGLRQVDRDRIGLLGRSMGGGVVYNALTVAPGLVDAAVVYAPVSSRTDDNFERWIRGERDDLSAQIIDRYGAPEDSRRFWRQVSPRTYFDRVSEPLLIHHGTADESCPVRWSRATYRALKRAGADARLEIYPGEPHAFEAAWPDSMRLTVRFFDRHLD